MALAPVLAAPIGGRTSLRFERWGIGIVAGCALLAFAAYLGFIFGGKLTVVRDAPRGILRWRHRHFPLRARTGETPLADVADVLLDEQALQYRRGTSTSRTLWLVKKSGERELLAPMFFANASRKRATLARAFVLGR
jgi:hypothetical protein